MALVLVPLRLGLVHAGVPAPARLLIVVLCGTLVYIPLALWRAPELRTAAALIRRRRAARA
jgi:hypothetical protein